MFVQRSVLSEGLSASSTRVWFFTRVNSNMARQMLLLQERLWTVLSIVRFVATVDNFMSPQTKRRTEVLSTGLICVKFVVFWKRSVIRVLTNCSIISVFHCGGSECVLLCASSVSWSSSRRCYRCETCFFTAKGYPFFYCCCGSVRLIKYNKCELILSYIVLFFRSADLKGQFWSLDISHLSVYLSFWHIK